MPLQPDDRCCRCCSDIRYLSLRLTKCLDFYQKKKHPLTSPPRLHSRYAITLSYVFVSKRKWWALEEYTLQRNLSPAKIIDARFKTLCNNVTLKTDWWFEDVDGACCTLGTRGFSRVRREFSVLTETGNRARKVSGTQGTVPAIQI